MEHETGIFLSMALTGAVIFLLLNTTLKLFSAEAKKIYFKFAKQKKISKYIEDGWSIAGTTLDGYPKTLQKDNKIIIF